MSCCAPEELTVCCEPTAKEACCGTPAVAEAETAPATCGCR